jgi:magnesium transporter
MHSLVGVTAEYLDFSDRSYGPASLEMAAGPGADGRLVWIDIDLRLSRTDAVRRHLSPALAEAVAAVEQGQTTATDVPSMLVREESFLHIRLAGVRVDGNNLTSDSIDIFISEGLLLTVHQGTCGVLESVRRDYLQDFLQHAASPSFLLYEFWQKQVEQFLSVEGRLDEDVEATRLRLRHTADEETFAQLANVSDRLLTLRKRVLPARRVLEELVSRKTTFVSEATLTFLAGMIATLERLLADITSNRDILESEMNFSLTVTTHRTNFTMNRLAVVSTIFLPLTFLCGVYGMNFEAMPETTWPHGYKMFWVISAGITIGLTILLRRARLL